MSQNGEANPLEITKEEFDMPTLVNPIVECNVYMVECASGTKFWRYGI